MEILADREIYYLFPGSILWHFIFPSSRRNPSIVERAQSAGPDHLERRDSLKI